MPLFADFNNSVRCSEKFTVEGVYWQKDLKISGYSDAYDALIGNYSRIVTNSSRSAMIINLGKDKTVCVLLDAAGNQDILSPQVHYIAIEEEEEEEEQISPGSPAVP